MLLGRGAVPQTPSPPVEITCRLQTRLHGTATGANVFQKAALGCRQTSGVQESSVSGMMRYARPSGLALMDPQHPVGYRGTCS